jgi:hypothetical protein
MISADKIPNNVDLHLNKRLQRALEHWQPAYIQWWRDMGPQGFQEYGASSWPIRLSIARSGSAISSASRSGRKCRASSATSCGG